MQESALIIFCNWVSRLFFLHVAFIVGLFMGGIIGGIAPSSVMVCTMLRRYLNGAGHISIKAMFDCYMNEFIRANLITLYFIVPALLCLCGVFWAIEQDSSFSVCSLVLLPYAALSLIISYCCVVMFSIYDAADMKAVLANALYLLISQKMTMFMTALCFTTILILLVVMPIVVVFFGIMPVFFTSVGLMWRNHLECRVLN